MVSYEGRDSRVLLREQRAEMREQTGDPTLPHCLTETNVGPERWDFPLCSPSELALAFRSKSFAVRDSALTF